FIIILKLYPHNSAIASSVNIQLKIEVLEFLSGVTANCLLIDDCVVEYICFTKKVKRLV
ncbi:Uncharacterized protein FWK35_00038132, partial [Aphis craccivora]